MIKESVTLTEVINFLNDMNKMDQKAVSELVLENKAWCYNDNIPNHPTIQVTEKQRTVKEVGYKVGVLGLINGLFGIDENMDGPITAIVDNDLVIGFEKTK